MKFPFLFHQITFFCNGLWEKREKKTFEKLPYHFFLLEKCHFIGQSKNQNIFKYRWNMEFMSCTLIILTCCLFLVAEFYSRGCVLLNIIIIHSAMRNNCIEQKYSFESNFVMSSINVIFRKIAFQNHNLILRFITNLNI